MLKPTYLIPELPPTNEAITPLIYSPISAKCSDDGHSALAQPDCPHKIQKIDELKAQSERNPQNCNHDGRLPQPACFFRQ